MRRPTLGLSAAFFWVIAQVCPWSVYLLSCYSLTFSEALWLHQGYNLEFLGRSSFVPGLFLAALFFFAVNVWILGIIVQDVGEFADEIVHDTKSF